MFVLYYFPLIHWFRLLHKLQIENVATLFRYEAYFAGCEECTLYTKILYVLWSCYVPVMCLQVSSWLVSKKKYDGGAKIQRFARVQNGLSTRSIWLDWTDASIDHNTLKLKLEWFSFRRPPPQKKKVQIFSKFNLNHLRLWPFFFSKRLQSLLYLMRPLKPPFIVHR